LTITNKSTVFAGELGCVDIYHKQIKLQEDTESSYYLFGVLDTCTQIVWVEVIEETEALTFMFASLKCFSVFSEYYNIKFKEIKCNNSFNELLLSTSSPKTPFERLLFEQNILFHKSKSCSSVVKEDNLIKEFWDAIYDDLLKDTFIENKKSLKQRVVDYLYYYNEKRVHNKLRGLTPNEFNKECFRHV